MPKNNLYKYLSTLLFWDKVQLGVDDSSGERD